ncbi:MAG: hypothetical protein ACRDRI_23955 [Pseudonocardiaceae bacterium]
MTLLGTPDVQFAVPRLRVGPDVVDPPTAPLQTPAVPPPPPHRSPRAGRPNPAHGGTEDDPQWPSVPPWSTQGSATTPARYHCPACERSI